MFVTVKILKGGECNIEVTGNETIYIIKQMVKHHLQVPVEQQKLVFKGKTMLDADSLHDYEVAEGNRLHCFIVKNETGRGRSSLQNEDLETMNRPLGFLEQVHKLLLRHFLPSVAEKVLLEFQKNLADKLRHLSLDNIEHIATLHLAQTADKYYNQHPDTSMHNS